MRSVSLFCFHHHTRYSSRKGMKLVVRPLPHCFSHSSLRKKTSHSSFTRKHTFATKLSSLFLLPCTRFSFSLPAFVLSAVEYCESSLSIPAKNHNKHNVIHTTARFSLYAKVIKLSQEKGMRENTGVTSLV